MFMRMGAGGQPKIMMPHLTSSEAKRSQANMTIFSFYVMTLVLKTTISKSTRVTGNNHIYRNHLNLKSKKKCH